ncbi:MAG: DUF3450 domain-containing protein [bacterium]|nr:DUF3450 domain-containing protein [bacterium]
MTLFKKPTSPSRFTTRSLRMAASAVCLSAMLAAQGDAGSSSRPGNGSGGSEVANARALIRKRAETWNIITKERENWQLGREIVKDQIAMAARETKSFKEKTAKADENITATDRKNDELTKQRDRLEGAAKSLVDPVSKLEKRVLDLLPRLPEPLRRHVKLMSQRITLDPEKANPSLAIRFGNVAAILQEVDKWNHVITIEPELLELEDGRRAEVTVLYLGIGQGYYVSPDNKFAGVGSANSKEWVWQPANEAAAKIREAIEIYQKKKTAKFVGLPVRVL